MADKHLRVFEVEILITGDSDPVIDGGNLSAPVELTGEDETITRGLIAGSLETPTVLTGEDETITRGLVSGSLETPAVVSGELGVMLDES